MSDLRSTIQDALNKQFSRGDIDSVDVVPIALDGDRMDRLRTLQEVLDEFDDHPDNNKVTSYLVQIKPKRAHQVNSTNAPSTESQLAAALPPEGIYFPNGKLNVTYLSKNAEVLFNSGEYALARNIYKAILQSGEKTAHAHYGIGRCHEAEGRQEEARAAYEESIAYHPSVETYKSLGTLLLSQGKEQLAAETFERAINLKEIPTEVIAELHKASGNCWMRAEKFSEAERHYKKTLELSPNASEILTNLGAVYLKMGQIQDAKRSFQEAMASDTRSDKAIFGLGSCYEAEGDRRQAHDQFARALHINLNNAQAIFHLVRCAYEIKSYATAARLVEEYIQVAPINANLLYSLAGLQFHLGRMEEAKSTVLQFCKFPRHMRAQKNCWELSRDMQARTSRRTNGNRYESASG